MEHKKPTKLRQLTFGLLLVMCLYGLGVFISEYTAVCSRQKQSGAEGHLASESNGLAVVSPSPAVNATPVVALLATTESNRTRVLELSIKRSKSSPELPKGQSSNASCPGTANTSATGSLVHTSTAGITHAELDHVGLEGPSVCDKGSSKGLQLKASPELVAAVIVLGHKRVNTLARCMLHLLYHWSKDAANKARFPLFVSIDGGDQRSLNFAAAWKETAGVQVISRLHNPAVCSNQACKLSAHYKMLMQLFFQCLPTPRIIFLEEDLQVSPDFFNYFAATAALLERDTSLWCVSAWNDHGQHSRVQNITALYRTDILPGLGWMITREHALPLIDIWPPTNWDDWMREPHIRKHYQCIFPEVSRTYHFAESGTNVDGSFFKKYLEHMRLNTEDVDWGAYDLGYLLQGNYSALMDSWLADATPLNITAIGSLQLYCNGSKSSIANEKDTSDLVLTYPWNEADHKTYASMARQLPGMIEDIRGGRPRASYKGIVSVRCNGMRLFLRPDIAL